MANQPINNDVLAKITVTLVIGATASGKTTFIQNHFSNKRNTVILNVYDYQQAAYKEAGFGKHIPFGQEFKCLYKANENLLLDIIDTLQNGKNVVVEQTLYKAKRRIGYIDVIRNTFKNIKIEVYVMCPSDSVWETYVTERRLAHSFQQLKTEAEQIEFPNPIEGFDSIYEVVDDVIKLRMDEPKPEIVEPARKEILEDAEELRKENEKIKAKADLLESMNSRPFWHYCEVCGTKLYCTAQEAFDAGWDYPPQIGTFGLLGPRTCGKCSITDTLWWKVQQQGLPIVIEKDLTAEELKTWRRIKKEPESLLEEEK
ncbi:ATP-binding protein [Sharpea azabuensis]|uniref:ATP-binding protein n=1 Tax=Sharpea porci TaxID=2652286 RepID=A0A844FTE2_9FIRM|nr:AAA family ATPase [Sharpea porci]MST88846.1 ATP-binding protein [Sharpea porci]